jgi:hypothetical protein
MICALDGLVAQLAAAWEERAQQTLPLEFDTLPAFCNSCGEREGTVVLVNGARWCPTCVQTSMAEPTTDTPIDARAPSVDSIIDTFASLLLEDGFAEEATAVTRARESTADLTEIRASLSALATQHEYVLTMTPPYIRRARTAVITFITAESKA